MKRWPILHFCGVLLLMKTERVMSRYLPLTTAVREVADLLSDQPDKVVSLYGQLAEIEHSPGSDNQKSKQAAPLLSKLCALEFNRVESASLRLEKFVHLGATTKDNEMNEVCKRINKLDLRCEDWHLPESLWRDGIELVMKLEGRLAIHLAGGVLENTGMCIHPHFNCPYLPGSGVKGVARHAAWAKWNETKSFEDALKVAWTFGYPTGDTMPQKEKARTRPEKDYLDNFLALRKPEWFGKEGRYKSFAGLVSFLPAFPLAGGFKVVADVLTCHHPDYYKGENERATDDESPIPQFFPVIESGSRFRFVLRPLRSVGEAELPFGAEVLEWARAFLIEGMTLYGAGAKTAAGYGWFSYNPDEEKRRLAQQEEARKRRLLEEKSVAIQSELYALADPSPFQFGEMKKRFDELVAMATAERMELPGKQRIEDALNRMKKKLPQASPLDQLREKWAKQNMNAVIKSDIAKFDKQKPEQKKLIVELLREPEGVGAEIWSQIRQGQKGNIAKGVTALRTYCKNELKLGKMP
ncbi:type III-B CRISPR module RAMP protein Cmr6 [Verrucomicrobia bacterium S94]|nr:type III-B CRISPR module RAMP protein Cmr6 [Verrucomicrobia bacterium S94]